MLYKSYEQKIKKLTKIIEKIYKFRFLILSIVGVILALVTTYLSIKGVFIGGITFERSTITYGEEIDFGARAIFSDVTYEFRAEGSESWVENAPITVGEHTVRAVSKRSFGSTGYSDEAKFIIEPKQTEITVNESTLVYGTEPTASATLIYEDKLDQTGFEISSVNVGQSQINADLSKVKVVNADGVDVTDCYAFTAPIKTVSIAKKSITLTSGADKKTYDGTPLLSEVYEVGKLCYGDKIDISFPVSIVSVGDVENVPEYKIFNDKGEDVTFNYNVKCEWGRLEIEKRPVTFKADDVIKVYDGEAHSSVKGSITGGELVDGHYAGEFNISGEMTDVGEPVSATITSMKIFKPDDNGDIDVTDNYQISYQAGEINVLRRKVKVSSVKSKIYDDSALVDGDYTLAVDSENDILSGQNLLLWTNDVIANDVKNNPVYDGDKIVYRLTAGEKDVTKNYIVDCSEVKFTIEKRPITVTADSGVSVYNGQPFTLKTFTYTAHGIDAGLIDGQEIIVDIVGSVEDVNPDGNGGYIKTKNEIIDVVIKSSNSNNPVTSSYDITPVDGEIYVTPCPVTVTFTAQKDYDDTDEIKKEHISYDVARNDGSGLFKDHVLVFDYQKADGVTEVRSTPHPFNVSNVYVYSGTEPVTKNYQIIHDGTGTLKINPIPLKITTESESKEFDRVKLTASNPEQEGLLESQKLYYKEEDKAYQLKVGSVSAKVNYTIKRTKDDSEIDKSNYTITENWGILTINKRNIFIEITPYLKSYDGKTTEEYISVIYKYYNVISGSFLDGDTCTVLPTPQNIKGEDGKTYSVSTMIKSQTYTVTGAAEVNYGSWAGCPTELIGYEGYYDIKVEGKVVVSKATVTIKTQSDEKVVERDGDGNLIPLANPEWWVVESSLGWNGARFNDANSTTLSVVVSGSQADVGNSSNMVSTITLGGISYDVEGDTILETENFIINIVFGTLTVYE